jgi:hypothetical protein
MTADVTFMGRHIHADVQPGDEVEFKRYQLGISFDGPSASDVAGGIMQGTCRQVGYAVLEAMTNWKRPAPPPPPDPETECKRGFHCRENAIALESKDPAKAARLYKNACRNDDEGSCLRAAELEMSLAKPGGDDHRAAAEVLLDMACSRDLARTCTAAARLKLVPLEPSEPASDDTRREALALNVRACDLGDREGCTAAIPLLANTPFAGTGSLLDGAATVKSKTLGTVFALHWGQWSQFDSGQATAWVTSMPTHVPEGAIVTPFSNDRIPDGIAPPSGVSAVYAVALQSRGDRCNRCMPSGGGGSPFSMRSMSCVCAIAPKVADQR